MTPRAEDNTLRMVANHRGVTLNRLTVEVTGEVDSRGCMAIDRDVPVGFLGMTGAVTSAEA